MTCDSGPQARSESAALSLPVIDCDRGIIRFRHCVSLGIRSAVASPRPCPDSLEIVVKMGVSVRRVEKECRQTPQSPYRCFSV